MTTPSLLSTPESRRLGKTIATMQAEIASLRAAQQAPQLGDSTLYGAIYIADPDGNVKGIVGEQADGSTGVVVTDGPAPPRPNTPSLTPLMSGVDVAWSGTFVAAKPLNFSHVNVYLSDAGPNFIEGPSNLVGTLSDAGSIPVAPLASGTQWWARLVAVNDSVPPKMSEPSLTVGPVTPDQVVAQDVLDGIVTEVKLANDAVTAAKIAAGAVGTGEIAGQAVTLSQLASGSVDATKLTSGAVTQPAIAANAVTANALAANSVIAGKLAADSVSTTNLIAGSVQATQIAAGAVLADKIAANAVTAEKINALAVTADKVAANAINAGHITAGAVTASKLAATLVLGTTIIAGTSATGARVQLNGGGIEAYRANGMKVLDFDTSTGDMTIAGRYRSQDGGTRVEINPGGNAPDEIRLYQGSVYARIVADAGPGNTAAVVLRGSGAASGAVGAYNGEAFVSYASSGNVSQSAVSCLSTVMNLWAVNEIAHFHRTTGGSVINKSQLYHQRGGDGSAWVQCRANNTGWLYGPNYVFASDNNTNGSEIRAAGFSSASSRRVKDRERPIGWTRKGSPGGLEIAVTPVDVWLTVEAKEWEYAHQAKGRRGAKPGHKLQRPRLGPDGKPALDGAGRAVFDEVDAEWDWPEPEAPKHYGPMAEDLAAMAPTLVQGDLSRPETVWTDLRDLFGVHWEASRAHALSVNATLVDFARRLDALENRGGGPRPPTPPPVR